MYSNIRKWAVKYKYISLTRTSADCQKTSVLIKVRVIQKVEKC